MKKIIFILICVTGLMNMVGCMDNDNQRTLEIAQNLKERQPTPTDISYSLERHNLIKRAYWVNGQREKANTLPCEVSKPLGYIVLITEGGAILNQFVVDGKITSLNSYLTADTTSPNHETADWLADVDGSYGENDGGIFFFTPDGKYIEWNGTYLYSDIPFIVESPTIKFETK